MEPSRCNIWQLVSVQERREERQPRLLIIACGTQTLACWALLPGADVYHRVGDRRTACKMSVIHLCRVDAGAHAPLPRLQLVKRRVGKAVILHRRIK